MARLVVGRVCDLARLVGRDRLAQLVEFPDGLSQVFDSKLK
ncbi:hypothetical protein EMIT0111MI5_60278 [Burkholderia sp. IT-111MI5]